MKSFNQFITESLNGEALARNFNLMQYLFLKVAKMKNLKRAATAVTKEHSGSQNWALGGHVPTFTVETLIDAYYVYRSEDWKKQRAKTPPEKHEAAFAAFVSYFFLDADTLKMYL